MTGYDQILAIVNPTPMCSCFGCYSTVLPTQGPAVEQTVGQVYRKYFKFKNATGYDTELYHCIHSLFGAIPCTPRRNLLVSVHTFCRVIDQLPRPILQPLAASQISTAKQSFCGHAKNVPTTYSCSVPCAKLTGGRPMMWKWKNNHYIFFLFQCSCPPE